MFKSARWRSDKNKIKTVFKLQFHATQLTQIGGDFLTIAVIPGEVGKPTARLEKSKVKDGSCYWEKPHHETVKLTRDQKTGKFNDKIYRFVVATGSSIFGVVGEVSIDFSSYAESTKLSSLSLPLKNSKSASVLHVSIQRVQDHREVNGSENANEDNKSLRSQFSDLEGSIRIDPTEDHEALIDNTKRDCGESNGSDITLSSSDSSFEPESKNTNNSTTTTIDEEKHQRSTQWDWLDNSTHELSTTDDSSIISPRETLIREISEEDSDSPEAVIKKLKEDLSVSARQADVAEMELQTLRKQILKESKRSQDLSKEVAILKEECEKMKEVKAIVKVKVNGVGDDPWALVDELRQEVNYEKDLNSNLRLQLSKTQEANAELILAVQDLDEMLEQKSKSKSKPNGRPETDDDEDQKALELIVREHSGLKEVYLQEQKIIDLYNEIELYKRDKEDLETQMEQIALDYEILKQEHHDMSCKLEQSQIQEQLKMQYECSTSYNELESQIENLEKDLKMKNLVIKELETHVKNLEEDLENQALGFEADMEDLMNAKVEQEQRAIHAEGNLRKVKQENANKAGKLQEEFRRLSVEMSSAFQENENAVMKAIDEANQLRVEKRNLEELVKQVKEELKYIGDEYEEKLVDLSNEVTIKSKHLQEMEIKIENMSHELEDQKACFEDKIEKLQFKNQNLENDLKNVKKDKDNEVERMKSEIERLKARCIDMKQFVKEYELEKENLRKQVFQLKGDLKKKDEAIISIEKKHKESNTTPRNNKLVHVPRSVKEVTNMKERIKLLEGQIRLKEVSLARSEALFLEKEKDLQHKIEELAKRLEVLDQETENTNVSAAENSNPMITSDDATKCNIKKTEDQEIFEASSKEIELLNKNKSMEVELKEMQERYSEISLKFAEVEGERQQLVMTLRNLKNAKKC